jgi:hypothetical protein
VREIDWSWDRAVQLLGKCHIIFRRADMPFMKSGLAGIWQDLIDAATEHDVAAQEQGGDPDHSQTVAPEDLRRRPRNKLGWASAIDKDGDFRVG